MYDQYTTTILCVIAIFSRSPSSCEGEYPSLSHLQSLHDTHNSRHRRIFSVDWSPRRFGSGNTDSWNQGGPIRLAFPGHSIHISLDNLQLCPPFITANIRTLTLPVSGRWRLPCIASSIPFKHLFSRTMRYGALSSHPKWPHPPVPPPWLHPSISPFFRLWASEVGNFKICWPSTPGSVWKRLAEKETRYSVGERD